MKYKCVIKDNLVHIKQVDTDIEIKLDGDQLSQFLTMKDGVVKSYMAEVEELRNKHSKIYG